MSSLKCFPEEVVQRESAQIWGSVFSLPSTVSDVMGKSSLRLANWCHAAGGAEEGREVGDKGVGVGVITWVVLLQAGNLKILTCLSLLFPSCFS